MQVSVVIPAYNEAGAIGDTVRKVLELYPEFEVIVVNDGSTDDTEEVARAAGAQILSHPYNKGNGASVRTGILAATGDVVVMMDGDGQHDPEEIQNFLECFPEYDFVVGARSMESQAGLRRGIGNWLLNKLASYLTRFPIRDLTSGFRAFKRDMILPYLHLFPAGFSYPTTSTLAMLKAGANLKYIPITAYQRIGESKIRLLQDGYRFFLIILKLVTLFSPMRVFLPLSILFGILGIGYSIYTLSMGHFTNMAALLIIVAMFVFLMGLIAEQLAAIHTQGRH